MAAPDGPGAADSRPSPVGCIARMVTLVASNAAETVSRLATVLGLRRMSGVSRGAGTAGLRVPLAARPGRPPATALQPSRSVSLRGTGRQGPNRGKGAKHSPRSALGYV